MRTVLRIRPTADDDVNAAAAYIASDNIGAALRFYDAVERTFCELRDHPRRWPIYGLKHPRLAKVRK
jgi:plasmid stabilization system protein ParE